MVKVKKHKRNLRTSIPNLRGEVFFDSTGKRTTKELLVRDIRIEIIILIRNLNKLDRDVKELSIGVSQRRMKDIKNTVNNMHKNLNRLQKGRGL